MQFLATTVVHSNTPQTTLSSAILLNHRMHTGTLQEAITIYNQHSKIPVSTRFSKLKCTSAVCAVISSFNVRSSL
jgi:hypothetical protein